MPGQAWFRNDGYEEKPESRAFIQWKGTDVCMDIFCSCGTSSHLDGFFAYYVQCPKCGQIYENPHTVSLLPIAEHELPENACMVKVGDDFEGGVGS